MTHKVFISSTGQDLQGYRAAAVETCNRLGLVPQAMEFFEAMGADSVDGSLRKLGEADLYVGIFAHRYGYIPGGQDKSITELEFDGAGELGLERLCFTADQQYPWPPESFDYKNYERLLEFKSRLDQSVIRGQFTTVDDFRAKLLHALVEWQKRSGDEPRDTAALRTETAQPAAAAAPPLPSLVVGREADLDRLKQRFGIGGGQLRNLTVVRGWPGVGKTTLTAQLSHDEEVRDFFADGVLWASVGESGKPFSKLVEWARKFGADFGDAPSLEVVMERMRALLLDKRVLLVVDDVWEADSAAAFKVGGPLCATLITTRFQDVARSLATTPEDVYLLRQLDDEQGFRLLQQLAPSVTEQYPSHSRQLVSDLEGLPLALRVAGRLLDYEAGIGFNVAKLFEQLRESSRLLGEVAPDDRFDPHTGTTPTIDLLLRRSTDRLDAETRDRFAYLGGMAPKPATFSLEAMAEMWEADAERTVETARKLVDRGLLEPIIGTGRFQLHAVLVMHARSLLEED